MFLVVVQQYQELHGKTSHKLECFLTLQFQIKCCHNLLPIGIVCTFRLIFSGIQSYHARSRYSFHFCQHPLFTKVTDFHMYSIHNSFSLLKFWNHQSLEHQNFIVPIIFHHSTFGPFLFYKLTILIQSHNFIHMTSFQMSIIFLI